MPRLHIDEYTRSLAGKRVYIACREGVLRDHFSDIITDIKFLTRQGIATTLLHNMSNRFANQKHFNALGAKLPATTIVKAPPETDFYNFVLNYESKVFKLIFLERKYLIDHGGQKINAITTNRVKKELGDFSNLIANTNFKSVLERICHKIENQTYERVHILPAGKHTIKYELFTIEGSGTLIANNFEESIRQVRTDEEVHIIYNILETYRQMGFLKPRTAAYVGKHRNRFYATSIDEIVVGCVEKIPIDSETAELGALAISTKFRNQRVGVYTVNAFIEEMGRLGYKKFISLTNNPQLRALYLALGFEEKSPPEYGDRQAKSPGVDMFFKAVR